MRNSLSDFAPAGAVQPFVYRDGGGLGAVEPEAPAPGISESEVRAREERARREARQETERGLGADLERRVQMEHEAVLAALADFDRQRAGYFQRLEREVVQLVLGISRKVLQREAGMDPLLLAGTVRVALDQLAAGTQVELFVPLSKMALWEEMLRGDHGLTVTPKLRSDPSLEPAGCRLETSTGATDLGLDAQLREIEQGFADLLARRTALQGAAATA
jgi:flagellar assembly protein FliH